MIKVSLYYDIEIRNEGECARSDGNRQSKSDDNQKSKTCNKRQPSMKQGKATPTPTMMIIGNSMTKHLDGRRLAKSKSSQC